MRIRRLCRRCCRFFGSGKLFFLGGSRELFFLCRRRNFFLLHRGGELFLGRGGLFLVLLGRGLRDDLFFSGRSSCDGSRFFDGCRFSDRFRSNLLGGLCCFFGRCIFDDLFFRGFRSLLLLVFHGERDHRDDERDDENDEHAENDRERQIFHHEVPHGGGIQHCIHGYHSFLVFIILPRKSIPVNALTNIFICCMIRLW